MNLHAETATTDAPPPALALNRKRTIAYFLYHMRMLPTAYDGLDTNRMTALYFCLSALDLLGALEHLEQPKESIVEWIYSLQVLPNAEMGAGGQKPENLDVAGGINGGIAAGDSYGSGGGGATGNSGEASAAGAASSASAPASWRRRLSRHPSAAYASDPACRDCGFIGSAFMGGERFDPNTGDAIPSTAAGTVHGHIAMTYTALASLVILGDDLARVAREPILRAVRQLQHFALDCRSYYSDRCHESCPEVTSARLPDHSH